MTLDGIDTNDCDQPNRLFLNVYNDYLIINVIQAQCVIADVFMYYK